MARNGSGTFIRLYDWTNDRDANIKILAERMDNEFDGVATALSQSIATDGQTTTSARIPFATGLSAVTGSAGTPSISFIGDTNTGLYSAAADTLDISCGGTKVCEFTSTGVALPAGPLTLTGTTGASPTPPLSFGSYIDSAGDVSVSHIDLWGGIYGFGISNNQINIISGSAIGFFTNSAFSAAKMTIASGGGVTMSGTLAVTGASTFSSRIFLPDGSAGSPSLAFTTDIGIDTGLHHPGDGRLCVSTNAATRAEFNDSGLAVTGALTATGATTLSSTLSVSGNATINGLGVGNGITSGLYGDGTNLALRSYAGASPIYFQNQGGAGTMGTWSTGGLSVSTPLTVGGAATLSSTLAVTGAATLSSTLAVSSPASR